MAPYYRLNLADMYFERRQEKLDKLHFYHSQEQ